MKKRAEKNSVKSKHPFIFWFPRILSIIFLLFLSLFSLDIFGNNYTFWQTILGLFMHNIPVFILTILLIIAWKHELVGAITFIFAGLLYIFLTAMRVPWYLALSWSMIISGPAFLIGFLFYLNYKLKNK